MDVMYPSNKMQRSFVLDRAEELLRDRGVEMEDYLTVPSERAASSSTMEQDQNTDSGYRESRYIGTRKSERFKSLERVNKRYRQDLKKFGLDTPEAQPPPYNKRQSQDLDESSNPDDQMPDQDVDHSGEPEEVKHDLELLRLEADGLSESDVPDDNSGYGYKVVNIYAMHTPFF